MTASQFEKLSEIIFKDKQEINCSILAKTLDIHVDDAKIVLDKFIKKHESEVIVEYMLSGQKVEDNHSHGMFIVNEDELESKKSLLKNATVYPYSIRASDSDCSTVLNFEKLLIQGDDFKSIQKYGRIHNEKIISRPDRRIIAPKINKPTVSESVKKPKTLFPKKEIISESVKIKDEPQNKMDALKDVSLNVSSPLKRPSQNSNDEIDEDIIIKRRKRVVIESDDESDIEFKVTKIKEETPEEPQKIKTEKVSPPTKKVEPAKSKAKPIKNQPSIKNFFKKG